MYRNFSTLIRENFIGQFNEILFSPDVNLNDIFVIYTFRREIKIKVVLYGTNKIRRSSLRRV